MTQYLPDTHVLLGFLLIGFLILVLWLPYDRWNKE